MIFKFANLFPEQLMMNYKNSLKFPINRLLLFSIILVYPVFVYAQDPVIAIGQNSIAANEMFTISATLNNEQLKTYSNFPDIPGFQKRGISSQSSTNIVNGQMSYSQTIVQNYAPTKEGKFKLPPFAMELNGKRAQSPGTVITVGPPRQVQQMDDPFAEFFGRTPSGNKEFLDVKEDAFFAITTSKDKVYVGEGFTATLAFYVAEANKAEMQFYDIGNQMQSILKKVKQANCWEENFNIEEIQPVQVVIDGKKFAEYKLYRATFYPLNKKPVKFPSLAIKMIKYKVAKNPSFFGQNKVQDFKTFQTKPKIVIVKDLPPHPLKENVSVGMFKLEESVQNKKIVTGKSFNYNFKIVGEGNIQSIRNPLIKENKVLDVYPPNTFQDINRSGAVVSGAKNFNYFMVPKEPGKYKMKDFIYWVYFNPKTSKYDTLKPKFNLNIQGDSHKNAAVNANDYNDFMDIIENYDNGFVNPEKDQFLKMMANCFIIFLFGLTIFVIVKYK